MKKVCLGFVFVVALAALFKITAYAREAEVLRYLIPEGATEVGVIEEYMDRMLPGEDKIAGYRDEFDKSMLPRATRVVFYDKEGNVLKAQLKPVAVQHIDIDPANIKIPKELQ